MIDDELVLFEEVVGDLDSFLEQPARVVSHVEDQPLQVAIVELFQRRSELLVCCFIEIDDSDIAHTQLEQEGVIYASFGNFVPDDREFQRFVGPLARGRHVDDRPLRPLEHFGHLRGVQAFGRFAVNPDDQVAWTQAGPKRR